MQFYSSFQNDIQGGWTAALKQIYKIKTQLSECEGDGISESDLSRNDYISDIINNAMKKYICFTAFFCFMLMNISAQGISEKDNTMLDNFIKSKVSIVKVRIGSDTLAKVFNGTFYKVDAGFAFSEDMSYCSGDMFVIKDGELIVLNGKSDSMTTVVSLVRKEFYLKTETDAKNFEMALDKLYPMSDMNEKYKEHMKIGNRWFFIRDKFFDSKSGFIVTLDQNSRIRNIGYSLEAIKK